MLIAENTGAHRGRRALLWTGLILPPVLLVFLLISAPLWNCRLRVSRTFFTGYIEAQSPVPHGLWTMEGASPMIGGRIWPPLRLYTLRVGPWHWMVQTHD